MANKKPSYTFSTQPYSSPKQEFDLNPSTESVESSKEFVTPTGFPSDFVSASKGGTFQKLVSYSSEVTPTLDVHLVPKGFMDSAIAAAVAGVEGGIDTGFIRSKFSAATPIEYNASTGVISLNATKLSNWDAAYGWGNHASQGYLEDITGQSIGSLSDVSITGISNGQSIKWEDGSFVSYTPEGTAYSPGTGISIAGTTISTNDSEINHNSLSGYAAERHFLQTEITNISTSLATGIVKVTTGTGVLSIITDNSSNWDTAYGWGDHSGEGYQDETGVKSIFDNKFSNADLANLGTKKHTDLTNLPGSSSGYHLSLTAYNRANAEASGTNTGFLTSTDWNTFNNKQDALTFGHGFTVNSSTDEIEIDLSVLDIEDIPTLWTEIGSDIRRDSKVGINKIPTFALDVEGVVRISPSRSVDVSDDSSIKIGANIIGSAKGVIDEDDNALAVKIGNVFYYGGQIDGDGFYIKGGKFGNKENPEEVLDITGTVKASGLADGVYSSLVRVNPSGKMYNIPYTGSSTKFFREDGTFAPIPSISVDFFDSVSRMQENDIVNPGPLDDCYLPSQGEFLEIIEELYSNDIGEFSGTYWTSTQLSISEAFATNLSSGGATLKTNVHKVRPIRHFNSANHITVGEWGQFGWVFYRDGNKHYEVLPKEYEEEYAWGSTTNDISGATGTAIGTGEANTTAIVVVETGKAANYCDGINVGISNNDRYIILDAANLNSNFGLIDTNTEGMPTTLEDNDIVTYVETETEFRIVFNAGEATQPATVVVGRDTNGNTNRDWLYNVSTSEWVDRGAAVDHNSLDGLNAGDYKHLTDAQYANFISLTDASDISNTLHNHNTQYAIKQSSTSDTTAGSGLIIGAFGLGAIPLIKDGSGWEDISSPTAFYKATDTTDSVFNLAGVGINLSYSSLYSAQLHIGTVGSDLKIQARATTTSNTWGAAKEIYHTGNLIDPVIGTGIANQLAYFTDTDTLSSLNTTTYPSLTELRYVKGVTGSVQTQLSGKIGTTLPSTNILVGNSSDIATARSLSLNATGGTFGLGNTGILTMPNANTSTRGLLTSTDWNTFNNKPTTFIGLSDTPANYTSAAYKAVRVNSGSTALEYAPTQTPQALTQSTGTLTWNVASGYNARVTLSANITTFNFSGAVSGDSGVLTVIQDATGSRTMVLPSGHLAEGGSLTLSTAGGSKDVLGWYYDGVDYFWNIGKAFSTVT